MNFQLSPRAEVMSRHGAGHDVRAEAAGYASPRPYSDFDSSTMPKSTSAVMPSMTLTATAGAPEQPGAGMTPQSFVRTLPSIINTAPTQMATCDTFTAWVSANPVLAGAMLLGLGLFMFKGGRN